MENYDELSSDDNLHITSFDATTILDIGHIIQGLFAEIGRSVSVTPAESKDEVQKDKRNELINSLLSIGNLTPLFKKVSVTYSMT